MPPCLSLVATGLLMARQRHTCIEVLRRSNDSNCADWQMSTIVCLSTDLPSQCIDKGDGFFQIIENRLCPRF